MKPPCDEAVIRSAVIGAPCEAEARAWILAATILGTSMAFIDSTVVNVALPAIQSSFHATVVGVQWVVESYGLLLSAFILAGGSLGDLFGRRLIFVVGVVIFAAASLGCGISANIQQLILARSIQGLGAALLVPGSLAIISTSFDEESRGQAIGTWSGFTAITAAIGPVLGGWLVQHASWRWAFFINLPLAAAVMVISFWKVPESRSAIAARVDWLGALFATIGLAGLVTAFTESVNLGWRNPVILAGSIGGFGSLFAFVWVERHITFPMVPLTLFESRSFTAANLLTLLLYAALGVFFFLFPLNLIQAQGYSATAAGAALLPFVLLMFFLSRWSGGLMTRYGARGPLILGPIIASSGFVLFAVPSSGHNYWKSFLLPVIVLGLGMAITVAPLTTLVMTSVEQKRVGAASGINNATSRVASVLAIAFVGILMVHTFGAHLDRSLASLSLPSTTMQQLQAEENQLAGMQIPAGLDASTSATIDQLIREGFVFGFQTIMLICAGLSLASAGVAWLMLPITDREAH